MVTVVSCFRILLIVVPYSIIRDYYRVRKLIASGETLINIPLSTEIQVIKLHMGNLSTLLEKMKPKNSTPASRQPQQRPSSVLTWRFNLNAIAQKLLGISKIFFDGK